jgi:hypothetical protein
MFVYESRGTLDLGSPADPLDGRLYPVCREWETFRTMFRKG